MTWEADGEGVKALGPQRRGEGPPRMLGTVAPMDIPHSRRVFAVVENPDGRKLWGTPFCMLDADELRAWAKAFESAADLMVGPPA